MNTSARNVEVLRRYFSAALTAEVSNARYAAVKSLIGSSLPRMP